MKTKKQIKNEYRALLRNINKAHAEHQRVLDTIAMNGGKCTDYLFKRLRETWANYLKFRDEIWPLRCEYNRALI